jgi:hypothetical protein
VSGLLWPPRQADDYPGPNGRNRPRVTIMASPPAEPGSTREPQGLTDPGLLTGIPDILAVLADLLPDQAEQAVVMPLIRDAVLAWSQRQLRQGTPVPPARHLEGLAQAVFDQRYGLGPLAAYLRDPDVENVDVNGCDRVWVTYSTGERVAAAPIAATDEALADLIRTWATRGGQTARDFSAASPLVSVALTGRARLTASMSVTPRPARRSGTRRSQGTTMVARRLNPSPRPYARRRPRR